MPYHTRAGWSWLSTLPSFTFTSALLLIVLIAPLLGLTFHCCQFYLLGFSLTSLPGLYTVGLVSNFCLAYNDRIGFQLSLACFTLAFISQPYSCCFIHCLILCFLCHTIIFNRTKGLHNLPCYYYTYMHTCTP